MKYIQKTTAPQDFINWCNTQETLGVNYDYSSLRNPEKKNLHNFLIKEQGEICAYTMKRITRELSHLEHIIPQTLCGLGQDVDYHNLVACFPQPNVGSCAFGAHQKDSWWDEKLFISPLLDSCELKFIYNLEGEVSECGSNLHASSNTIDKLKLNEKSLSYDRKRSIEGFIFGNPSDPHSAPLSFAEAHKAIDEIHLPNATGQLYEFCIAIHDALYEYLDILEKVTSTTRTSTP